MIIFEDVKDVSCKEYFSGEQFACDMFQNKYSHIKENGDKETPAEVFYRVASGLLDNKQDIDICFSLMYEGWFRPGGSILQGVGSSRRVSTMNCTTVPLLGDSLEDISKCDYDVMKCAAFRQGIGFDASKLRPEGAKINNAAEESTGVVPWINKIVDNGKYVGQCLHGETLVLCADGQYKKLSEIVFNKYPGEVWGDEGRTSVVNWFENGVKKLFKVTTEFGDTLKLTENHKILTANKGQLVKKKLADVFVGDYIVSKRVFCDSLPYVTMSSIDYSRSDYNGSNRLYVPEKLPSVFNEDLAYICGLIYGDGCQNSNGTIDLALALDWPEIKEKVFNILDNLFGYTKYEYGFCLRGGDGRVERLAIGKYITTFLNENGIEKQKAGELIFPEIVKRSSKSVLFSFFAGVFDSDGYNSMSKKNIDLTLIDYQFLYDLKMELAKYGVLTKVIPRRAVDIGRSTYKLSLVGKRSCHIISDSECGSIKLSRGNLYGKYDQLKTPFTLKEIDISDKNRITEVSYGQYVPDICYENISGNRCDYYIQKVSKIEFYSEEDTYDITVSNESHLYSANNFIVSNSGRLPALLVSLSDTHPDIFTFIESKTEKGQIENANISVQISDKFMEAVKSDADWELRFDFDNGYDSISRIVKAKEIFDLIAETAYKSAEPGVQFRNQLQKGMMVHQIYEVTGDKRFEGISSNACCFASWVTVHTSQGDMPISDVVDRVTQGEIINVVSRNMESGVDEYKRVLNGFIREEGVPQQTIVLYFNNNVSLECTLDHKFYTVNRGLVVSAELTNDDILIGNHICEDKDEPVHLIFNKLSKKKVVVYNIEVADNHNYYVEGILAKNSEKFLPPYGICNLNSINMEMFDPENYKQQLQDVVPYIVKMADAVVDYELENNLSPLQEQRWVLEQTREIGCGITNIHGWLMKQNLAYDSDVGIDKVADFWKEYTKIVFQTSVEIGREKGNAPAYDRIDPEGFMGSSYYSNMINTHYDGVPVKHMRNLAHISVAPVGSISNTFPKPCVSSGVEPIIAPYYWRKTRIQDRNKYQYYFIIPNRIQEFIMDNLDKASDDYKRMAEFSGSALDEDGSIGKEYITIMDRNLPKGFFKPSHDIDYNQKIKLMARLYDWMDASISCTFNLPKTSTVQDVKNIYMAAYDYKVRAVSVYIDESREGILVTEFPQEKSICTENRPVDICYNCAPKRPKELRCAIHQVSVKGERWVVLVGMFNDKPFEIFCGSVEDIYLPQKCNEGVIVKQGNGKYSLKVRIRNSDVVYEDIAGVLMSDNEKALTRLLSLNLRHGVYIQFIVDQLKKSKGDITSFSTAISRVLGKYVIDYVMKDNTCPLCGKASLSFDEGCIKCLECGYSRCD